MMIFTNLLMSYFHISSRRLLCEYPTNSLNKIFASMKLAIDKNKKPVIGAKISDVLLSKKGKELFPNDTLLKEKVSTLELYKDNKDNLRTKFILSKIATYLNPKEPVDCYSNNISIEHIMPQKLTKDWEKALGQNYSEIHAKYQHNIGNLTLTAYNSELSNDIFSKKKEIYKNSNITLTRNISAKYDTWGENEIVSRCNNLIEIMSQIWKYPGNVSTVACENTLQKEFNIFEDFNPTGKTPYEFEFNDETLNVNSWIVF